MNNYMPGCKNKGRIMILLRALLKILGGFKWRRCRICGLRNWIHFIDKFVNLALLDVKVKY